MKPPYISRREFTPPGVPKVPEKVLEAGSTLLEELDAPSSVAEFDHVQAKLESDTNDTANKMERAAASASLLASSRRRCRIGKRTCDARGTHSEV